MKIPFLFLLLLFLQGCAGTSAEKNNELDPISKNDLMVSQKEYAFTPPSEKWRPLPTEGDITVGFYMTEGKNISNQTSFAYHEEPYGYSRNLGQRMGEFYKRFLWASRVTWETPRTRGINILGREGLEATAIGTDPVQGNKVFSRVIFTHRGERIVAFYFTQWRDIKDPFDSSVEAEFQKFLNSFHFLKPSFYEEL